MYMGKIMKKILVAKLNFSPYSFEVITEAIACGKGVFASLFSDTDIQFPFSSRKYFFVSILF